MPPRLKAPLLAVARLALWLAIGLVLVRGASDILSPRQPVVIRQMVTQSLPQPESGYDKPKCSSSSPTESAASDRC